MDNPQTTKGEGLQQRNAPNWTNVRIGQLKSAMSHYRFAREIYLSSSFFSGEIHYIEMQRETETTQVAYVTFSNSQGANTAAFLTGCTMAGLPMSITVAKDYQLPPHVISSSSESTSSAVRKTEEVVSTMLAKGFVLGKDALKKAKSFDEKHHLTENASAKVTSIDRKMGLSEKLSIGKAVVNDKVKEMDELYHVAEKTKSALAAAEQKASSTGSAILSNHYVSAGASWVSNALSAVSKAAEDVGMMTKEKVEKAEEEKRETIEKERAPIASEFVNVRSDEYPVIPVISSDETKHA